MTTGMFAHPWWCDPDRCDADSYHWSTPATVPAPRSGDLVITMAARTSTLQPPADWTPTLVIRVTRTGGPLSVEEYEVDVPQYAALVDALGGFWSVMATSPEVVSP